MEKLTNMLLPAKFKPRHKMTNIELQGFRHMMRLDVKTMAELAGCSVQSWYGWEGGTNPVPERTAELMDQLKADFYNCLTAHTKMVLEQDNDGRVAMRYYETFEMYSRHFPKKSLLDWRINQAVGFRLLFDKKVYLVSAENIEGGRTT